MWHIDFGLCELLKPIDKEYDESGKIFHQTIAYLISFLEVGEEIVDNIYLRTNYFEADSTAKTYIYLYDSVNDQILNKIELFSGECLEIELAGFSIVQVFN